MVTAAVSINPFQRCFNGLEHGVYQLQEKVFASKDTDGKIYAFLILGRVLQTAAIVSFVASVVLTFIATPLFLIGAVSALAFGALGTAVAEKPEEVNNRLQMLRPFIIGQPVGLRNQGNNCWLNTGLQLLANAPAFHPRLRQNPDLAQVLDAYIDAERSLQKIAQVDTRALRIALSRQSAGLITEQGQDDAALLFEFLFEGVHAPYRFDQRVNGGPPVVRCEPMVSVEIGSDPRAPFQQLFNGFFHYQTDVGQTLDLTLPRAPDDLLIHAKRFTQSIDPSTGILQGEKNNLLLSQPERLTMQGQFVREGQPSDYLCDGFLIHDGFSMHGGHYTCYLKRQNTWWYTSDSTVFEVPAVEALAAMNRGYIFHYKKV